MSAKHLNIHEIFESLDPGQPWTSGLVGLVQHLSWETEDILGKSRTKLIEDVIKESIKAMVEKGVEASALFNALDLGGNNENTDHQLQIAKDFIQAIKKGYQERINKSTATERYEKPAASGFVSAYESQRRIRYFSENFLNKELDIFFALLPDATITKYLSSYFHDLKSVNDTWNIFGSSNEFDMSVKSAGQPDTLAYSKAGYLVAIEIKVDATLQEDQLLKYCCIYHDLLSKGFISPDTKFKFLVISAQLIVPSELDDVRNSAYRTLNRLVTGVGVVKDSLTKYKAHAADLTNIIDNVSIVATDWQQFGNYFAALHKKLCKKQRSGEMSAEIKLIRGFLDSLSKKYSRKLERCLYVAE